MSTLTQLKRWQAEKEKQIATICAQENGAAYTRVARMLGASDRERTVMQKRAEFWYNRARQLAGIVE